MKSFFKIFLASMLALVVFSVIAFFVGVGFLTALTADKDAETGAKAVLFIDLARPYPEISRENPLSRLSNNNEDDKSSLYDVIRMIHYAQKDSAVKGIYLKCGSNANSFGASEEMRKALLNFKSTGKFIYAYGDAITQGAYYVGTVATRLYCNPKGGVDWRGYAAQMAYVKGTLEKLEIEPQIFYAGKFKSATEPLREKQMTEANRVQLNELIGDLYGHFLLNTATARKLDTATLHQYANENRIQFASDALKYNLVDGLKYEDEVKEEIRAKLGGVASIDKINFVSLGKYAKASDFKHEGKGRDRIAVIYAQGDIVDGKAASDMIGGETVRELIRKARLDKNVKAIVIRINSGGGSTMASENLWREVTIARKNKPVVVSYGDVSASGGYYMSCNADSIFAQPTTITGSIGVFGIIPNMQKFFNNKLGVTFDGVKTSPDADMMSISKPLTETQKKYIQNTIDTIYLDFKTRVAEGRKKNIAYVDSIAQGRVWSGTRALQLGLIDRLGGLDDAIACAARMGKVSDYKLREYPEPQNFFQMIFGDKEKEARVSAIKAELGEDGFRTYNTIKRVKGMMGIPQSRIPFELVIE